MGQNKLTLFRQSSCLHYDLAPIDPSQLMGNRMGPDFSEIKRVDLISSGLGLGHDLYFDCPVREVAVINGLH